MDNLKFAFAAGQEHFGIVPLLEPEDMLNKYIDELSVMTYVSFYPKVIAAPSHFDLCSHFPPNYFFLLFSFLLLQAYERAAKAHEILILKRSTSKLGNLGILFKAKQKKKKTK